MRYFLFIYLLYRSLIVLGCLLVTISMYSAFLSMRECAVFGTQHPHPPTKIIDALITLKNKEKTSSLFLCQSSTAQICQPKLRAQYINIIQQLINQGERVDQQDAFGRTPLSIAAQEGYVGIARLLLHSKASVTIQDQVGQSTALHHAAKRGTTPITQLLIEHKAPLNARDSEGNTPLHPATSSNHIQTIRLLLAYGACANEKNNHGVTPIHLASMFKQHHAMQLLLNHDACLTSADKKGAIPIEWAVEHDNYSIVRFLVRRGAAIPKRLEQLEQYRTNLQDISRDRGIVIQEVLEEWYNSPRDLTKLICKCANVPPGQMPWEECNASIHVQHATM